MMAKKREEMRAAKHQSSCDTRPDSCDYAGTLLHCRLSISSANRSPDGEGEGERER